jgi:hypothetical protein
VGPDSAPGGDLQAQIDALILQMGLQRRDIDALGRRADDSDTRADLSDARADGFENRADASDARSDRIEARALIDRDMIAELQRDGVLSRKHEAQLEEALKSSREIGAAIGIVMQSRQVPEEVAFNVLRTASRTSDRRLREVAAELVATANLREPSQ